MSQADFARDFAEPQKTPEDDSDSLSLSRLLRYAACLVTCIIGMVLFIHLVFCMVDLLHARGLPSEIKTNGNAPPELEAPSIGFSHKSTRLRRSIRDWTGPGIGRTVGTTPWPSPTTLPYSSNSSEPEVSTTTPSSFMTNNHEENSESGDSEPVSSQRPAESSTQTLNPNDYVISDAEFDRLLQRLADDQAPSIRDESANYVADNMPFETIISMIDAMTATDPTTETPHVIGGWFENRWAEQNLGSMTNPMETTPHQIESIDEEDHSNLCAICLSRIEPHDRTCTIGCGHRFHEHCLERWHAQPLSTSKQCPVCRKQYALASSIRNGYFGQYHDDAPFD